MCKQFKLVYHKTKHTLGRIQKPEVLCAKRLFSGSDPAPSHLILPTVRVYVKCLDSPAAVNLHAHNSYDIRTLFFTSFLVFPSF